MMRLYEVTIDVETSRGEILENYMLFKVVAQDAERAISKTRQQIGDLDGDIIIQSVVVISKIDSL